MPNPKTFVISDTHWFHFALAHKYGDRPADFDDLLKSRWHETVCPWDTVIHLGDVSLKNATAIVESLPGHKVLVRGNHDRGRSLNWWLTHGFDFVCDGLVLENYWMTHEPSAVLPFGCHLNIHGHLHNIWSGNPLDGARLERDKHLLSDDYRHHLKFPWQRLFAVEYTNYAPVELSEFIANPERYQATGPTSVQA